MTDFQGVDMAIIAHSEVHDRFMSKVDVSGDCWEWRAAKDPSGYGAFKYQGTKVGAHRVSYEMHRGPIPDGLWLDHLCRNRACVRPDHLEPVKPGENTRRGLLPVVNALRGLARTRCKRGHLLVSGNLVATRSYKACLTCERERNRRRMATSRAAARMAMPAGS